ncbi:hypothetical protein [Lacrimispora celerecrescens]|uniref:Uncharacterized protein n=1 Tax=[Clostridium] celerecrescens 18A TaxID=1286362 RepID=A0A2M8Z305_9FIRM|nr:hypothetical protein [Lacrimispora celerecrescens]PJJ27837.1 hypothetical protein H171_1317 [[Clostridium] celerecrescens 18A]
MPEALNMGVPYDLFWRLNPRKLLPFVEAYRRKQQQRSDEMWLMGQYVASALDATVCNAMPFIKRKWRGKYFEEPIRVTPKTEEEKRSESEKALQGFIFAAGTMENDMKRKKKGE